ncbi:MAG TPA: hypothetical protein VLW53_08105, partial [Candidatus Eisenbacteria bacterium]|nr:hypothetical protein [Candidatus Eisenbacteria bacterium]
MLGVPFPPLVLIWACVIVLMAVVLQRTVLGRRVYATGSNPGAADLALVPTRRIWTGAFAVSALHSALVGALLAGFSGLRGPDGRRSPPVPRPGGGDPRRHDAGRRPRRL